MARNSLQEDGWNIRVLPKEETTLLNSILGREQNAVCALGLQALGERYFADHGTSAMCTIVSNTPVERLPAYSDVRVLRNGIYLGCTALAVFGWESPWEYQPEHQEEYRPLSIMAGELPLPGELIALPGLVPAKRKLEQARHPVGCNYATLERGNSTSFRLGYTELTSRYLVEAVIETDDLQKKYAYPPKPPAAKPYSGL